MMKIYTIDDNQNIEEITKLEKGCWIDLVNPSFEELNDIAIKTGTDKDLLYKLLDLEELPRIEKGNLSTLIVVDTPVVKDNSYKHKYNTEPFGIIINENDYLITIALKNQKFLNDFKDNDIKVLVPNMKNKLIMQFLLKVAGDYQKVLRNLNEYINSKEKVLCKSTNNKELIDLLNIEKTLVYFSTSLKANDVVLEKLSKGNVITLCEDDQALLSDAIIENKQAIEMANIYREILTSMTDTYATIISNNLNDVMKFLASVTIVFSIPTMVASFVGMNVPLGKLGSSPFSFLLIILLSILLALVIAYILRKKNML